MEGRQISVPVMFEPLFLFTLNFFFGENPTRINLVNAYAVIAEQDITKVSGQGQQCAFGDAVRKQVGLATPRVYRADVEHRAVGLAQGRQCGTDQRERRDGIDIDYLSKEVGCGIVDV